MDFSKLDGYEFEELVLELFRKMDFTAEQTPLSGDGGVDIIAYNKNPIYKGKYLIQCKNWNSQVGQPEVRDMYGVVISENATKGIIVTTSHFSEQAIKFADNKNIELIDSDILVNLLNTYKLNDNNELYLGKKALYFTENINFEKEKYLYLKSKIENDRSEKEYYFDLKNFYQEYIKSPYHNINANGLIDEYISLNNEIIKRFCKKGNEKLILRKTLKYINAYLYFLKGKIFNTMEILSDLKLLDPSPNVNFAPYSYVCRWDCDGEPVDKVEDCSSPLVLIKNLYLIYEKFGYAIGTEYIESLLLANANCYDRYWHYIFGNKVRDLEVDDTIKIFDLMKNDLYNKIHILQNAFSIKNKSSLYDFEIRSHYSDDVYITYEDLMEKYYNNNEEAIINELDKSMILLDEKKLQRFLKN